MTIVFEQPLDNPLSPHHYIEFKAHHAGAGIQAVRIIRDEIKGRVEALLSQLLLP